MNKLTIQQVQEILDVSYPTALGIARQHGSQDGPAGKWHVPASVIGARISEALEAAQAAWGRFEEATQ